MELPLRVDAYKIEIIDFNGRIVDHKVVFGGVNELNVALWPSGIYMVRVDDESIKPVRFVKQQ